MWEYLLVSYDRTGNTWAREHGNKHEGGKDDRCNIVDEVYE